MKKRRMIVLFFALILCASISANAHGGKTDANGGHYDHETGEYHYHHGYSAHQHYDMNGDGRRDCPYDFDDKTGVNSGPSGGSGNSSNFTPLSYSDGYANGHEDGYSDGRKDGYSEGYADGDTNGRSHGYTKGYTAGLMKLPSWGYWVIAALAVIVVVLILCINAKSRVLAKQKREFEEKAASEKKRTRENIAALHSALVKKYGDRYLYEMSNAPDGVYMDDNLLPHTANVPPGGLSDKYMVYLGGSPVRSNTKYHHIYCRYANSDYPINVYTAKKHSNYQPCRYCASQSRSTEWVDRYVKYHTFLSEYVDIATNEPQVSIDTSSSKKNFITFEECKEKALQMGVSIEAAKLRINEERKILGLPPAIFEKEH